MCLSISFGAASFSSEAVLLEPRLAAKDRLGHHGLASVLSIAGLYEKRSIWILEPYQGWTRVLHRDEIMAPTSVLRYTPCLLIGLTINMHCSLSETWM